MADSVHAPKVSFTYTLRGAGWARGELVIGDTSINILASYLTDALGDLVRAAAALSQGAIAVAVPWVEEPGSNEWSFEQTASAVRVRVNHHESLTPRRDTDSGEPRFDASCSTRDLCLAIADGAQRVLDELDLDGYRARWKPHPFPTEPLAALKSLLTKPAPDGSERARSPEADRQQP